MNISGLLIRGFGVRVPGGRTIDQGSDLVILPGSESFDVHGGRLCAPEPKYRRGRNFGLGQP
jgi:hypothetical protein